VPRRLEDAVVVITGASSGIGRATALAMSPRGTKLVLAARDEAALEDVRVRCGDRGAEAVAVPTDVADEAAVDELGRRAADRFGRIDVWVNNAGVILYGRFEDTPADAFRRVIETNLFGQVHGARTALPYFRRQGSGVLINMSSVWGRVTSPQVSAYVTSKFAIRAFSESLREELRDADDIHVVTILPQAVKTPMFQRAGNFSGRKVRQLPLAREADEIAKRIVWCSEDPKREVTDRRFGRFVELAQAAAPPVWEAASAWAFERMAYAAERSEPNPGNLFDPVHEERE
jgi:NAD(P)-dependent dehydrogenase (short-subunit alcohol dehydrogenase family)